MLAGILSKVWGYLVGVGVLLAAILAALGMAKRAGVKQEREAETEKALQQAKEANEIDAKVRADSPDELAAKLRKYQRD